MSRQPNPPVDNIENITLELKAALYDVSNLDSYESFDPYAIKETSSKLIELGLQNKYPQLNEILQKLVYQVAPLNKLREAYRGLLCIYLYKGFMYYKELIKTEEDPDKRAYYGYLRDYYSNLFIVVRDCPTWEEVLHRH